MITVRGVTCRFLNAVMALHRRAILRDVAIHKEGLALTKRRVENQERIVQAEQRTLATLSLEEFQEEERLLRIESKAKAELATLVPRI